MTTKFTKIFDGAGGIVWLGSWPRFVVTMSRLLLVAALTLSAFYLSLVSTTIPVDPQQRESIDRAIELLRTKGFEKEVFVLGHAATFLAPRYYITGGGNSDIIYGDIAGTLDNTSAISDFVAGVAEK